MTSPAVDAVVVSWNNRDDVLACVQSLLASTGVDLHVIVVDNASGDGTADALTARHPGAKVLRNPANIGFARAANLGIAAGVSPLVLLINPDAEVPAGAVAVLAAALEALPGHAAVAPRLVGEDGRAQHSVHLFPSLWVSLLLNLGAQRLLPRRMRAGMLLEGSWDSDVERDVPWAIGAALLVRRSTFEHVGQLDESFFVYAEDMEWCDRAARMGMRVRFLPSVTVRHLGNRSGAVRYGEDRTAAYLRNTLRFARRRHGKAWTGAFKLVNGAGTVLRYGLYRGLQSIAPRPAWRERVDTWRPYARFYLGRAPEVDREVERTAAGDGSAPDTP